VTVGALPTPRLEIDLGKLRANAATVAGWCRNAGLGLLAVTKGVRGDPRVARALLEGGAMGLADARLSNCRGLQDLRSGRGPDGRPGPGAGPVPLILLRAPTPAEAAQAVVLTDGVLAADADTAEALARAAAQAARPYRIYLPVDLGDLREGVLPEDAVAAALAMDERLARASGIPDPYRRAHVAGLAANMACFAGVVPRRSHLTHLAALAREAERALGRPLWVSAGNTAVLPLLLAEGLPPGLGDLRVGEGILLGRDSLHRRPLPGCRQDAFVFKAAVIEVGVKASCPTGELAEDAFGHRPFFTDRGRRLRAVVAAGRQDIDPEGLTPLEPGIEVVGATSDHLVLDVEDYPGRLSAGTELGFSVNYACLLRATTSPDVARIYTGEA